MCRMPLKKAMKYVWFVFFRFFVVYLYYYFNGGKHFKRGDMLHSPRSSA